MQYFLGALVFTICFLGGEFLWKLSPEIQRHVAATTMRTLSIALYVVAVLTLVFVVWR